MSFIESAVVSVWNDVSNDAKSVISTSVTTVTTGITSSVSTIEGWVGVDAERVREIIQNHLTVIHQVEQDLERVGDWCFSHSEQIAGVLETVLELLPIAAG